jgi:hydroxyethylthiazole kinase
MNRDAARLWTDVQTIRKNSPLIHNITNYVVMEQTANSLLALGASPVMAHALEEVAEMTALSIGLVLNIGTLSPEWAYAMQIALKTACEKKIPIVLDPVGAGATHYRTQTSLHLLKQKACTLIRGNASEILALNGVQTATKGVDSTHIASDYIHEAKQLALSNQCIVWMSGKTDVITDGVQTFYVHNGHPLMASVTGMGCTASALSAAFLAVNPDRLLATTNAALCMGICGQIAAEIAHQPGSFKIAFVDALYSLSLSEIERRIAMEIK